jgi:hypothetical protein
MKSDEPIKRATIRSSGIDFAYRLGLDGLPLQNGRWFRFDRESWPLDEISASRDGTMKPTAPE